MVKGAWNERLRAEAQREGSDFSAGPGKGAVRNLWVAFLRYEAKIGLEVSRKGLPATFNPTL